jgi:hypothetical protein
MMAPGCILLPDRSTSLAYDFMSQPPINVRRSSPEYRVPRRSLIQLEQKGSPNRPALFTEIVSSELFGIGNRPSKYP